MSPTLSNSDMPTDPIGGKIPAGSIPSVPPWFTVFQLRFLQLITLPSNQDKEMNDEYRR